MAKPLALTYRFQGIPARYSKNDVQTLICRLLNFEPNQVRVGSLARHPLKDNEKIATLSLSDRPNVPATTPKTNEWLLETPDESHEGSRVVYSLDTHFHGFTPLHDSDDEECSADLVAVSGLNGHAFGSFKAKGTDFMWIRDALPKDFPKCRLFIYGYDTTMVQSASYQSILDLGSQLAASLIGFAYGTHHPNMQGRSLFLIGHSLGGILVQEAVIQLSNLTQSSVRDDHQHVVQSLRAILLFGVPQLGMSVEALRLMVCGQPNRDLIASLSEQSGLLELQHKTFCKTRSKLEGTSVIAFYETVETPTVQKVSDKWEMTGPSKLLVTKNSATSASDRSISINRNHSEMVKFTPNDVDYDRVLTELKQVRGRIYYFHYLPKGFIIPNQVAGKEETTKALHSLGFAEQYWRQHQIGLGRLGVNTCEWLDHNEQFRTWLQNPEDPALRMLWIGGHPGSGKSALMKYAQESLNAARPKDQLILSFFFHARGVPLQKSRLGFLRSILHQLLSELPACRKAFTFIYLKKLTVTSESDIRWTEEELQDIIKRSFKVASQALKISILVDALDEAGKPTAEGLIDFFREITVFPNLRVLFSCRYYPILRSSGQLKISMEDENRNDIDRVVGVDLRDGSLFGEEEAKLLENDIIKRASGMFQWATLVTRSIISKRIKGYSVHALRTKIGELPPDLSTLYASLLSEIEEQDKSSTLKLIHWVLFALRPLHIDEIRYVIENDLDVSVQSDSKSETKPNFDGVERAIKTFSGGLVEIQTQGKEMFAQFIHQSVPDFLLQEGGLQQLSGSTNQNKVIGKAHLQLSRSCIRCLLQEERQRARQKQKEEARPIAPGCPGASSTPPTGQPRVKKSIHCFTQHLSRYAQEFWIVHTMHVESNGINQEDLLDLLPWLRENRPLPRSFRYASSTIWTTLVNSFGPGTDFKKSKEKFSLSFHTIEKFRHFDLGRIQEVLWQNENVLSKPFPVLALAGLRSLWKRVLREVEERNSMLLDQVEWYECSPLLLLLFGNADINTEDIPEWLIKIHINHDFMVTPLFLAVATGREDFVRAFIRHRARLEHICKDVNGSDMSVLSLAFERKNEAIIRLLVDAYDVKDYSEEGDSALHFAIRQREEPLVRDLLRKFSVAYPPDKFINFKRNGVGAPPIEYALARRETSMCRLLAEAGADLESSHKGSPLLLDAVKEKSTEKVSRLLKLGANPNSGPPKWPSPFMAAISNADQEIIDLLLQDNRTDPNLTDEKGLTALMRPFHQHCELGRAELLGLIQHCISSGKFDLEAKDKSGETLLSKAVSCGRPELVDVLLSEGHTDLNTQDTDGYTPLMKSAINGFWTITKLLISCEGIDVRKPDRRGSTALCHAVIRGQTACANLIVSSSKINAQLSMANLVWACFDAMDHGYARDVLKGLSELGSEEFRSMMVSKIKERARFEKKSHVLKQFNIKR